MRPSWSDKSFGWSASGRPPTNAAASSPKSTAGRRALSYVRYLNSPKPQRAESIPRPWVCLALRGSLSRSWWGTRHDCFYWSWRTHLGWTTGWGSWGSGVPNLHRAELANAAASIKNNFYSFGAKSVGVTKFGKRAFKGRQTWKNSFATSGSSIVSFHEAPGRSEGFWSASNTEI